MSYLQSIFLGVIQGLTEFLPISSSGHLVLFQKIFGFSEPPIFFDVLVHLGTMFAVLVFFRNEIKKMFFGLFSEVKKGEREKNLHLLFLLILGTIPIIIVGVILEEKIETIFSSLYLVGFAFLISAFILFLTAAFGKEKNKIEKASFIDAVFIGLFQALAILPGVSRSGSTISAGLFRGIKKEDAFSFSFFLGIIAIFGATILQIPKIIGLSSIEILSGLMGFFTAFVFGFLAIKILKPIVIKGSFYYFGIYCLALGIICFIVGGVL